MRPAVSMQNKYSKKQQKNLKQYVDFVVDIESGRDIVILQLTDPQIIDSAQVCDKSTSIFWQPFWQPELTDERLFGDLGRIIEKTNPDLILLTGDLVYGRCDDAGTSFAKLADFIDGYGIPWAPIFGNHDNESNMGADWQSKYLESRKTVCLNKNP